MKGDRRFTLHASIPSDIPLMIMMRALGLEEDSRSRNSFSVDPNVQDELESFIRKGIRSQQSERRFTLPGEQAAPTSRTSNRLRKAESVLDRNFLPHLGRPQLIGGRRRYSWQKSLQELIEVKREIRTVDDKDHYANKSSKLAGSLLAELFRISFRNLTRDLKYQLERITIGDTSNSRSPTPSVPEYN